jgi:ribosome-associated protein
MEEPLEINESIVIPAGELSFRASRSGGPGGQHVNKTASRVSLYWDLAGTVALDAVQRARVMRRLASRLTRDGFIAIHVEDERSQHQNRRIARERLAAMVAEALVVRRARRRTSVSASQKRRRLDGKRRTAEKKRLRRGSAED